MFRMNAFCAFSLTALAFCALLCGCGGAGDKGAILKVGNGAEVQDLDPHLVSGVTEHRVLTSLFEGLADVDAKTLEPVPGVAESWNISEDGLTYIFHLRHNARWSNGDPITAGDFVFSWQRILSPALAAEYAYLLFCLKNAQAFNEGRIDDFGEVGVRALDDHTLEVVLEHPTPYFLAMQIHSAWLPVHPPSIQRFGDIDTRSTAWTRAGNHVSNGAFALTVWRPNDIISVRRNPNYWGADAVRLDGIDFYPIDNQQTEERSFRTGELHITSTIPLDKVDRYRQDNPEVLNIHPYLGIYFYRMNVTRPPFTDPRVRRAFTLSLDRETLTRDVLTGDEPPAYHFTPPGITGYNPEASVTPDLEEARRLLAEAGYPDGRGLPPVDLLYNTAESHKRIAEAVQRMWKERLNVEVRLMNQDWKVYLSSLNNLDYTMARSAWVADVVDPINFLECFLTGGGNNRTGWSSPEFDALIQAAYAENDSAKRHDLFDRAEAILLEEAPIIPIYFYTWKYLKAPQVQGQSPNVLGYMKWKEIYLNGGS